MADPFVEVRGDLPQATPGASRMTVLRQIVAEWCERKKHESILIQRVTHGNGSRAASQRRPSGTGAES